MKPLSEITDLQLIGYSIEAVYRWVNQGKWTLEDFQKYIDALKKKYEWIGAWNEANEQAGIKE